MEDKANSKIGENHIYQIEKKKTAIENDKSKSQDEKDKEIDKLNKRMNAYHAGREPFITLPKAFLYLFMTPLRKQFSKKEMAILNYLLIKTIGFHKTETYYDRKDISNITGYNNDGKIGAAVKELQKKNIIEIEKASKEDKSRAIYTKEKIKINPLGDLWLIDLSYLYSIQELSNQVNQVDDNEEAQETQEDENTTTEEEVYEGMKDME